MNVQTPNGVCVGLVAGGLEFPRGLVQARNGDVFVADMGGWHADLGSVWRIRKLQNGTYESHRVFDHLDRPSGIGINSKDGLLYVGTPSQIIRFDPNDSGRPGTVVIDNLPSSGLHPLTHFVFDGRDADILYVNAGSSSNECQQGDVFPTPCPDELGDDSRASIRRYRLSGPNRVATTFTTVARGLRNSIALAVHPQSNVLLQGENSRDAINAHAPALSDQELELPHDELNVIRSGVHYLRVHYGWPYCYDNNRPSPEYPTADCSAFARPALLLPGHAAPLGMAYYPSAADTHATKMFPQIYRGNLIVAYHGYRAYGHRLVMVPVDKHGVPGRGQPLDIIRGWDADPEQHTQVGAPVGVIVANDGAIWVTQDKNHTVLRVSYNASEGDGQPMTQLPQRPSLASTASAARIQAGAGAPSATSPAHSQ